MRGLASAQSNVEKCSLLGASHATRQLADEFRDGGDG